MKVLIDGINYELEPITHTAMVCASVPRQNYFGDIVIPASISYNGISYRVTSIGDCAFEGCSGLTSISIPDGVMSIGRGTFFGCSCLISITIPNSVTSIGERAFFDTHWLNNQPDGLVYINKVLYEYKGTMPQNTNIVVRQGTLSISDYAFLWCSGLISIIIPDSVMNIGEGAFASCSSLISMSIPPNVMRIGESAFSGCRSLTSIIIPEGVTCIWYYAFFGCRNLATITLPRSITEIGKAVFADCRNLQTIRVPQGMKEQFCKMGLAPWRDKIVEI